MSLKGKLLGIACAVGLLLAGTGSVLAQQVVSPCSANGTSCVPTSRSAPLPIALTGTTTTQTANFSLIAANTTNSTLVKGSAGVIYEIAMSNNSATPVWLKLYDSSTAPTCGSGTPVARYMIHGEAGSTNGATDVIPITIGKDFTNGIAFCLTGGIADSNTTAVAASTYIINLIYK